MKHTTLIAIICLLCTAAGAQKPFTIPEVGTFQSAEGRCPQPSRVSFRGGAFKHVAQQLADDYQTLFGKALKTHEGKARKGDIELRLDKSLADEAYTIEVTPKGATLCASTPTGMYWATRTLIQISEQSQDRSLPCGTMEDKPAYPLRGLMVDAGRKFIPLHYLEDLICAMSYHKLNTLHIHLNDNGFPKYYHNDWKQTYEAFRLESDLFPELTAQDGFYTKFEFQQLQEFARQHCVEIIPEIDFPAHSLSFTRLRPELASKAYGDDHLDLFHPNTYTFLDSLLAEYVDPADPVFTGKYFHIGTDEYNNRKPEVVEAFRAMTDRYLGFVQQYGKRAACWGSLTHAKGETPVRTKDVLMYCWSNDYANPKEMHDLGYQLLSIPDGLVYIVPAAGYYYDYLNCKYLYENWTPANFGNVQFDEGDPQIEGGMAAVWNDHPGNGISTADIHHRLFPALQTIAQKTWAGASTSVPYAVFDSLRTNISEAPGVDQLGLKGRPYYIETLKPETERVAPAGPTSLGYPYSISMTIDCQLEELGTVLTEDLDARFYLCDPEEGHLAFERDGYLIRFDYVMPTEGRIRLTIEGDNESTRLFVDGKLQQELRRHWVETEDTKARMAWVPTLRFPLLQSGEFRSTITNVTIH